MIYFHHGLIALGNTVSLTIPTTCVSTAMSCYEVMHFLIDASIAH